MDHLRAVEASARPSNGPTSYSHSMVDGGFDEMSKTTRLPAFTSVI